MADQNARYRTDDPYGRAPDGPASSDPLAELARLIGQNDPFSEFGRESRAPAQRDEPAPHYGNEHDRLAEWQSAPAEPAPAYDPHAQPLHQAPLPDERHYDSQVYGAQGYQAQGYQAQAYEEPAHQGYARETHAPDPGAQAAQGYDPAHYDPHAPGSYGQDIHGQNLHGQEMSGYETQQGGSMRGQPAEPYAVGFDFPAFAQAPAAAAEAQPFPSSAPPFHREGGQAPADDFYDDAPQSGRRKGMVTVMAVLCLAVLGTVGAYGYRSIFGGSSTAAPPPVIRANVEPSRVAPPPPSAADAASNKLSYERFGDRSQNEQVVLREEQPVDTRDLARSNPPRVVLPGAPAPAANAALSAAANPPSVLTEPKRVRTVPIRPDQADANPARSAAAVPVAPPPRQMAAATPANGPLDVSPQASAQPVQPVRPPVAARAAARPAQPAQAAAPVANGPLSLSPDASAAPPPAQAAPARPTRVAAAPSSGGGGYLVQVSSQRSEADAQTSFRSIQSKYGSVLGDRQPVIRRADLGDKGTYYRAMVGPFTSREQAVQLCGSLKAAGGDCVVQGN